MEFKKIAAGFTLLELLIVISVLAVMTTLSAAGFSTLLDKLRMDNAVNSLVHSLHLARQKSHLTGLDITLCKSTDGAHCHNDAAWHNGWVLFVNRDQDDPPAIDPGEPVIRTATPPQSLQISANRQAFHIRPFGRRSTNGTFVYCSKTHNSRRRSVVISYTGKPRKDPDGINKSCD